MKEFASFQNYSQYERVLKRRSRYIYTPEIETFLQTVLETTKKRVENVPKDSFLWRAQLGHDWRKENEEVGEVPAPYSPERMQPRLDRALVRQGKKAKMTYFLAAGGSCHGIQTEKRKDDLFPEFAWCWVLEYNIKGS